MAAGDYRHNIYDYLLGATNYGSSGYNITTSPNTITTSTTGTVSTYVGGPSFGYYTVAAPQLRKFRCKTCGRTHTLQFINNGELMELLWISGKYYCKPCFEQAMEAGIPGEAEEWNYEPGKDEEL